MIRHYDKLCACGCGGWIPVKKYHRYKGNRIPDFISGHNRRGAKLTEEHKKRFTRADQRNSVEQTELLRQVHLGKTLEEVGHKEGCLCGVCKSKRGEGYRPDVVDREIRTCACGCGEVFECLVIWEGEKPAS